MKTDLNNFLGKSKTFFESDRIVSLGKFILKYWFYFSLLAVFAVGLYLFYNFCYNFHWSDQQKQNYLTQKKQEVIFKENDFDTVVGNLKKRQENFDKDFSQVRDIFQ